MVNSIAESSLLLFLATLLHSSFSTAFQLNLSMPYQCSTLTATWQGGTPPYELLLVPVGHVNPVEIRTIISRQNITTSSYALQLPYPQGSKFVAVLSDATGAGTGGTTDVLTVGPPHDGNANGDSCLAKTSSHPEFYFYLSPTTPNQCENWQIAWPYTVQGLTVWAVIPGKVTFEIPLAATPDSQDTKLECYNWVVDVPQGNQLLLIAGDSEKDGRGKGGSTDLMVVGNGTDSNCLASNPLSSTTSSSTIASKPTMLASPSTTDSVPTALKPGAALPVRSTSPLISSGLFLLAVLYLIL